jgi:HD-GYP domain-containing protein (c-di-GMP phosphodiesterase class II)
MRMRLARVPWRSTRSESGGQRRRPREATREALVEEARGRVPQRLGQRERLGETLAGVGFLAVATALVVLLPSTRSLDVAPAVLLLSAYALASRIKFEVGAGYTVPTQLLFVPMLFFLPTPVVPLFVAGGSMLGDLPDYLRRRRHPERLIVALGDSWHAIGPVLVLTLGGAGGVTFADWPVYLAALAAQFAFDLITNMAREWFELGVPPRMQLVDGAWIYAVDALLSPIGLFAALSEHDERYVFLVVAPLIALLAIFAGERRARLEGALELSQAYRGTTTLLADVIEHDDQYTGDHSRGVVSVSLQVAEEMGLDARQRRNVEFAALLHDVGKLAISKQIINKPGPLSSQEWALMRLHTVTGERMLLKIGGLFDCVARIVRSTHERWDGTGYPDGLRGEEIPLEARVVACCDAFNAMVTDRPYRPALTVGQALAELDNSAGTQFDPAVAKTVTAIIERDRAEHSPDREAVLALSAVPC